MKKKFFIAALCAVLLTGCAKSSDTAYFSA